MDLIRQNRVVVSGRYMYLLHSSSNKNRALGSNPSDGTNADPCLQLSVPRSDHLHPRGFLGFS